jgi:acyl carrier protein
VKRILLVEAQGLLTCRSNCGVHPACLPGVPAISCFPICERTGRLSGCSAASVYGIRFLSLQIAGSMGMHVSMVELTEIMRDVFDDDNIKPTETMTADDVEGWDSLSHIRLIVSIEKRFNIKFTNAEVEKLRSVGDLLRAIEAKL